MAVEKNPPKFITTTSRGRNRGETLLSQGGVQQKVITDGLRMARDYRYDEVVHVYQLVAVVKPKPMEFITETFAVCKAPVVKKES